MGRLEPFHRGRRVVAEGWWQAAVPDLCRRLTPRAGSRPSPVGDKDSGSRRIAVSLRHAGHDQHGSFWRHYTSPLVLGNGILEIMAGAIQLRV